VLYIVYTTNAFLVLNIGSYNRSLSKLNTSHAPLISRQEITPKATCLLVGEELTSKCQFRV